MFVLAPFNPKPFLIKFTLLSLSSTIMKRKEVLVQRRSEVHHSSIYSLILEALNDSHSLSQAFASSKLAICGINLCLVNFGSDKHLAHVILGQLFQNSNLNKK